MTPPLPQTFGAYELCEENWGRPSPGQIHLRVATGDLHLGGKKQHTLCTPNAPRLVRDQPCVPITQTLFDNMCPACLAAWASKQGSST